MSALQSMSNVNGLNGVRREFPNWNMRGKVKKLDAEGNFIAGHYAFNGETVRISPRFQRNGTNFRIRPERPVHFFAAFCFESGLLPEQLSPTECEQAWALEILEPIFEANKHLFTKLESPHAASDQATVPNLRNSFSFNIPQLVIEMTGTVRPAGTNSPRLPGSPVAAGAAQQDAIRKRIEEMRARGQFAPANPAKKKSS